MPSPHQAFIEMNTEEAANTMVNYYTSVTPVLRGQPIYIQFSNHKGLKTDSSPNQAVCHPLIPSGVWGRALGVGLGRLTAVSLTAGPGSLTRCELGSVGEPGTSCLGRCCGCRDGDGWPEPSAQDHRGEPLLPGHPGCASPGEVGSVCPIFHPGSGQRLTVPFLVDFLQVWHRSENHHFHQEQPVPGTVAVC